MIYTVQIEGFGRTSIRRFSASSHEAALEKGLALVGFKVTVTENPNLNATHTGGVTK